MQINRKKWLRLLLVLSLIFSVTVSEAAALPSMELDLDETEATAQSEQTGRDPAESSPDAETQPEKQEETKKESLNETEAFVSQMVSIKSKTTSSGKTLSVKENRTEEQETDVQAGLLLAKRLKKLSDESEFSQIIFRGSGFVNVRSEASSASELAGKMYYNAVASIRHSVYQEDGLWYEIESGNVRGFVKSEFFVSGVDAMDIISETTSNWVIIQDESLRLYEFASTDSATLATLSNGVRYKAIGTDGSFTKIYVGNTPTGTEAYGYALTEKLTASRDLTTAITLEEEAVTQAVALEAVTVQNSLDASREASRAEEVRKASIEASIWASKVAASRDASLAASRAQEIISGNNITEYANLIPAGTSALRRAIVTDALQYVGVLNYVWGGESLVYGADCSGFVRAIYLRHGFDLAHYTVYLAKTGTAVNGMSNARPGDLFLYRMTSDSGHVGIYIGSGYMVHSPSTGQKVKVTKADYMAISTIRNVIGD